MTARDAFGEPFPVEPRGDPRDAGAAGVGGDLDPPDDAIDDLALDDALGTLTAWMAEARVDEAADERRRTAWLRRQAEEEATFAGVLVDLAERGRPVAVRTTGGRTHRGHVVLVGRDVVGIRLEDGTRTLVASPAVASVQAADRGRPIEGAGIAEPELTLATALRRWSTERPRVAFLHDRGVEMTAGRLVRVGLDVATVELDGGGVAYVPLSSVTEVSVTDSG